jgi:acetylornithine deacetylase/succinyl-diaminopimelate desuccinylase-like protein
MACDYAAPVNHGSMKYSFKVIVLLWTTVAFVLNVAAQSGETLKVREYIQARQGTIVNEFVSFLTIPNVASDTANIRRNADFIMNMMKKRGIAQVQLLKGKSPGVPPAVYGEVKVPKAKQTLIFYAHYDGQPVNPVQWAEGLSPFTPKLFAGIYDRGKAMEIPASGVFQPDWRLYARGASDDKGGVMAILLAYEAIVQRKLKLNYNLKFFFEGEEEAGSPHLADILQQHSALLQSDLWVICDGPVHQTGKKVVSFGVRGDAHLDLTIYGPKRPLHSGHYGNWAPNPGLMLARLLSSMKDEDGKVTIQGFYDDVTPLSAMEQKAIQDIPNIDDQIREELGLGWTENKGKRLSEAISMPSLNINGMQSGNVGKMASNQIPTTASAVLDLRLVLGNDWKKQQQKVIDHIQAQGYTILDHEPTDDERSKYSKLAKVVRGDDGYNAQRTSMDMPIARKVVDAVKSTTPDAVVLLPTSGGSLPLFVFKQYLDAKTISVPIANHDNNQHAENENIRLGNLFTGIETMAGVMGMKE